MPSDLFATDLDHGDLARRPVPVDRVRGAHGALTLRTGRVLGPRDTFDEAHNPSFPIGEGRITIS
jgi:hypothetical protein